MTFKNAATPKKNSAKSISYYYFLNFYQTLYPEVPFSYWCPDFETSNDSTRWPGLSGAETKNNQGHFPVFLIYFN